jgi:Ca2+:H+ antiporter
MRTYSLLLIPASLLLEYALHAPPLWIFIVAALAIIPLADWIRYATEEIAKIAGSAIGGLLNVTFGNMAELILALFVLTRGNLEVVKAQITGSIIGNSLLGLGLGIVAGSFGRTRQCFNRDRAGQLSSMLMLCLIALVLPAVFDSTERGIFATADASKLDERFSLAVSIVLIFLYLANLAYTLRTHKDVFETEEDDGKPEWSLGKAIGVLIAGTVAIALEAELVSGALEASAHQLGLSTFFLGITVLAVVGNAAEYVAAVYFARKDQMGIVVGITVGSTIQVALFAAPILVIASYFMGHPMNLVFQNPLELIAIIGCAFAVNAIAQDGETTWFEGVLLLGVYLLLCIAFYYATPKL